MDAHVNMVMLMHMAMAMAMDMDMDMDAALKIIIGLFGSIRWFCVSKAHLMNLGTSWLGFGPVEQVQNLLFPGPQDMMLMGNQL